METRDICYIAGAGDCGEILINRHKGAFVIAADGGFEKLEKFAIDPDLTVGDFDSLNDIPVDREIVRHPTVKDDTDMVLAVNEGLARGYRTFVIYGGLGGRLDHTYANIQVLAYLSDNGAAGYLIGQDMVITALKNGRLVFDGSHKGIISVFCSGDRAKGVSLKGLKYPLDNAALTCKMPIGVSNEFTGQNSSVEVKDGTLIVMWHEGLSAFIGRL